MANHRQPFHQQLLDTPKLNQTITLKDGRTLGYAEYGDPVGKPVLYFHGGNGSRLEGQWFADAARAQGVRLIAPDRPGFGLSDFASERQLRDWCTDVEALTDALGIDRFSIFGLSGGGPFVATLSRFLSKRLTRAAIISGTAPPTAAGRFRGMWFPVRMIFFLARRVPPMNSFGLGQMGKFYANPEQMRKTMMKGMPKPDVAFFERVPESVDIFSADASEAHRNGTAGDAYEWQLYVHDWGFRVEDIEMEVGLWFGRHDIQVPKAMGDYYASALKHNVYHLVDDGGHFSTINNHISEIFDYLTETA
jgi:pimeloyl-ACP methyl ester carboxylesterase